jgi:hypothetical protein
MTVYGTAERQTITVSDVAGTVTFDPSFNKGGDTIVLAKSAASYTIAQSGSTVILSDGDSRIIIPVGTVANTVQFSDGDRTLLFSGGVKIGSQAVTTTATTITTAGTTKSTLAADSATQAARLILSEESASVGGNVTVYGTAGVEGVSLLSGGNISFDPSFNKGGDTIVFAKSAESYSAQRSGSSILIKDGSSTISIPVGTVGLTADFNGDKKALLFANGDFKVGADAIPTTVWTPLTTSNRTYSFEKIVSVPVSGSRVSLAWEALSFADVNGDKKLDIVLANGGNANQPIAATDNRTSIFLNDGANKFNLVDTSNLDPTGWVNDWVFMDANGNGINEIYGIDHGREIARDSKYWSKIRVYEWNGKNFSELTNSIPDNSIDFYHNASSVADLNGDGIMDFAVATMGNEYFSVFYGSKDNYVTKSTANGIGDIKSYNTWGSSNFVGVTGAAGIININGENAVILLPYKGFPEWSYATYANMEIITKKGVKTLDIRTNLLPSIDWGYSTIQFADLNGDGRTDFIAGAENPSIMGSGTSVYVTAIQNASGGFDFSRSFPKEDANTKTYVAPLNGNSWSDYKFQLIDVDGDKVLDVFWGAWFGEKSENLKYSVFFGDGTGQFYRNPDKAAAIFKDVSWEGTGRTLMQDVNGDGLGDLVVFQQVWTSNTESSITPIVFINHVTFG